MNDFLHMIARLPTPILVVGFIFIAWLFNQVFGPKKTPVNERGGRAFGVLDHTPPQNSGPMPVRQVATAPPPLPATRGKKKKAAASRLQQAAADAAKAQATQAAAATKAVAAAPPAAPAQPVKETPADSVRRYLQFQRGGKEAFMLFQVLGKPKSLE